MDNYNRYNRQKREYENDRRYNTNRQKYDNFDRRMDNRRNYETNRYNNMRRYNAVQDDTRQNYSAYARRPVYREEIRHFEHNRMQRRGRRTDVPTKEVLDADLAKYMRGEMVDTYK